MGWEISMFVSFEWLVSTLRALLTIHWYAIIVFGVSSDLKKQVVKRLIDEFGEDLPLRVISGQKSSWHQERHKEVMQLKESGYYDDVIGVFVKVEKKSSLR